MVTIKRRIITAVISVGHMAGPNSEVPLYATYNYYDPMVCKNINNSITLTISFLNCNGLKGNIGCHKTY